MKIFICCLVAGVFTLALADVKSVKESVVEKKKDALASEKSSDYKPKRDASLSSNIYHGPSYKYLPPSSVFSLLGSGGYSAGYSDGHISGVGSGYSLGSIGGGRNNLGFFSSGHHNRGAFNSIGYAPATIYRGNNHHGLDFTSSSYYSGRGSTQKSGEFKDDAGIYKSATFGHNHPHYAIGHGYSSSGSSPSGSHSHSIGAAAFGGAGSGYHSSRGSISSPASSAYGSVNRFSSSQQTGIADIHHGDHVHNGAQEQIFVISNEPAGFSNSHNSVSVAQKGSHGVPSASYLSHVQEHPLPSNSYGIPIETGDSYNTKYHSQPPAAIEHGRPYATGHKGLGRFGFTANKPQVLHTSILGSNFNKPSYSKAPFKPSEFLGVKYEGSANNDVYGQQYLSPSGIGSIATGYDYHISSGPSTNYQEPSYQQSVEVKETSVHEPDSAYLPPNNNEGSFNELSSAPSVNYLPPSNGYSVPYSH